MPAVCALLAAAAPAAAAPAPEPPPNPALVAQVVGQTAGRATDVQIAGGVVSWVADPGPGEPRAVLAWRGRRATVTYRETVRRPGPLPQLHGFPVGIGGAEAGAAAGLAAAIDEAGVRVAALVPSGAYAAAGLAPSDLDGLRVVAAGQAAGLVVRPGGVFWTQGGSLWLYRPEAGAPAPVAAIPAGWTAEGADVDGSLVVHALSGPRGSRLVAVPLAGGTARVLATSPGLLQGPVIAGGWAVVRERRAFGPHVVDRIIALALSGRKRLRTLLQFHDGRAGRVFLEPPRAEGRRVVVVQTYSRDALGARARYPSAGPPLAGLRSVVRVLDLPAA